MGKRKSPCGDLLLFPFYPFSLFALLINAPEPFNLLPF